jgi:hypothetical protein
MMLENVEMEIKNHFQQELSSKSKIYELEINIENLGFSIFSNL